MTRGVFFLAGAIFIAIVSLVSVGSALAQTPQVGAESVIDEVEIRGNRRIPKESILYYVQSKPLDRFDLALAQRDLQAILQMGLFDPLATKLFLEDGPRGGKIIIFQVKEYPIIRDLQYRGMKSATESEVLTRFKEKHVQVTKESTFDPAKTNGARLILRELLAEKGHPSAEVSVEVEDISATTVALIFKVEEGPRVRVKEIEFVGARDGFSQGRLRGAMKLVKEAGFFSTFSSKDIYFKEKLQDDLERVRFFLGTKGYLQAKLGEPKTEEAGKVSSGLPIPLLRKSGPGLKISVPIEVGRRYKITKVEEKGVTIFQPGVITLVSGLRKGEYADAKKISENVYKGIKDLYGTQGYIQADINPIPKFIDKTPEEGEVEWTLDVEEGRQFTLRRLEFIGNTNTRDVVLRREVLMNEGDAYNKRNWDLSIIRLNQLGLFDEIKEKDAITRTNDRDQTVDIDLQVKEKGRQQIQLNGGVSGFAGSFFGLEYSTNNLLGYGESLSFAVSGGNRSQSFQFGFTEPYLMGKPISLGFQVFASKAQFVGQGFNFTQALQASFFGLSSLNADTLFTQRTVGGTISLSGPLALFTRKFERYSRFTRLGLSYSLTGNAIQDPKVNRDNNPANDIPVIFSQPRIITSRIVPSIYYNTKNAYLDPTSGKSLFLGFAMSGGILGGDVNTFAPSLEFQYFRPIFKRRSEKPHVLAMRFKADHIRAFGKPFDARQGDTRSLSFIGGIPIFERFFLGGEYDIRGYNFRSITPVVASDSYLSTRGVIMPTVPDPADSTKRVDARTTGPVADNVLRQFSFQAPEGACAGLNSPDSSKGCNTVKSGTFFTPIGADTQFIYNLEYRLPVISILSLAAFADVGTAFNSRKYSDQITSSNFVNGDILPTGVLLNPAGNVATADEVASAPKDSSGNPIGFRTIFLQGDSQRFDIVRASAGSVRFLSDVRSSLGLEFRVQMPVINVPFRLIFAYNPQAKTDLTDPTVLFIERKTVVRFSVGRTF
ncbi:MAG TPA: outer membrane protein assembly factor BamA [Blastocatellia bacterium]|nr:outer membrane protein assembly factor BamA [Blastocatellia bacterium]